MRHNGDSLFTSLIGKEAALDFSGKSDPLNFPSDSNSLQHPGQNGLKPKFALISGNISELKPGQSLDPNQSSFRLDLYQSFGKSISAALNAPSEALGAKRGAVEESSDSEETRVFTAEEQKAAFMKQVSKIKYYWRGTNLNYPFAFHKFSRISKRKCKTRKLMLLCEESQLSSIAGPEDYEEEGEYYLLVEDYSNKLINPAEKLLKLKS